MRKEKRGHAWGTDDRSRAGVCGRPRHDGMRQDGGAGGKGKGMGGSTEKEDCAMSEWRKIRGWLRELERRKRFSKKFKQVIGNAI
jgi:hypothetical protein